MSTSSCPQPSVRSSVSKVGLLPLYNSRTLLLLPSFPVAHYFLYRRAIPLRHVIYIHKYLQFFIQLNPGFLDTKFIEWFPPQHLLLTGFDRFYCWRLLTLWWKTTLLPHYTVPHPQNRGLIAPSAEIPNIKIFPSYFEVGITTGPWVRRSRNCGLIPGRDKRFYHHQNVQTGSVIHTASNPMGTGNHFLQKQCGRGTKLTTHTPTYSRDQHVPSWRVQRATLPLFKFQHVYSPDLLPWL